MRVYQPFQPVHSALSHHAIRLPAILGSRSDHRRRDSPCHDHRLCPQPRLAFDSRPQHTALEIGTFRFQNIKAMDTVYQFRLYAIPDPGRRVEAEERIKQLRVEILEASEQLLRQADKDWLTDPTQTQIRDRLMEVVGKHMSEPLVQRVLITDWLEIPTSTYNTTLTSGPATLPIADDSSG